MIHALHAYAIWTSAFAIHTIVGTGRIRSFTIDADKTAFTLHPFAVEGGSFAIHTNGATHASIGEAVHGNACVSIRTPEHAVGIAGCRDIESGYARALR